MKIVILNSELRSVMQMYLALSSYYHVDVAMDLQDLMALLDSETVDCTFLDLGDEGGECTDPVKLKLVDVIIKKHPETHFVGICGQSDPKVKTIAYHHGINKMLSRPVKNRDLFKVIETMEK